MGDDRVAGVLHSWCQAEHANRRPCVRGATFNARLGGCIPSVCTSTRLCGAGWNLHSYDTSLISAVSQVWMLVTSSFVWMGVGACLECVCLASSFSRRIVQAARSIL